MSKYVIFKKIEGIITNILELLQVEVYDIKYSDRIGSVSRYIYFGRGEEEMVLRISNHVNPDDSWYNSPNHVELLVKTDNWKEVLIDCSLVIDSILEFFKDVEPINIYSSKREF